MAAVADPKENLACFAFAYFRVNPDYKTNPEEHKKEWIDIFKDFKITKLKKEYKENLEPNFNFSVLKTKYSFEKGKGNAHLESIYNQMVSLFDSNFLKSGKDYRIYGQDSVFVDIIKNKCLYRISNVFKDALSSKASVTNLTPSDFYIVNINKINEIKKDFINTIIKPKNDETILLNYLKHKDKTYIELIKKYFKSGDLIPISHKMPAGRDTPTAVKLSGDISNITNVSKSNLDPYAQLLIVLNGKTSNQVEKIIEDVIDIKYDKWDIKDNGSASSWKLFFDFNYKKIDPAFENTIFGLEPLPANGSGSFNGKFYVDASKSASTPWVAGMAPKSLEPFLRKYSGYNQIMSLFSRKTLKVFDNIVKKYVGSRFNDIRKLKSYKNATKLLISRGFHTFNQLKKVMQPFFDEIAYDGGFETYQKEVIKMIKTEGGFRINVDSIPKNRVYEHYTSLQLSYFFFVGGRSFKTFLKKAIFFTIFGAITKRGFKKVGGSGTTDLLKKKVSFGKMYENVEASLNAAPHLIML